MAKAQVPNSDYFVEIATLEVESLARAIAHEVGNHLAAIRLTAHLLKTRTDPDQQMDSLCELERIAGQAGAMLACLRPVVVRTAVDSESVDLSEMIAAVDLALQDELEDEDELAFDLGECPLHVGLEREILYRLLFMMITGAKAGAQAGAVRIHVSMDRREDHVILFLEDHGNPFQVQELVAGSPLYGRNLELHIAAAVLDERAGKVRAAHAGGVNWIELILPEA